MIDPVSQRTYARIEALTRRTRLAGHEIVYCPCRVLPETVLGLKTILREVESLWRQSLGEEAWSEIAADRDASRFFNGRVRLVEVQEGRPEMVGVWLPVPPDYPGRLKVQLIDHVEPYEEP